jgi:ribosomal-protein-alanine N-acetyltransferase
MIYLKLPLKDVDNLTLESIADFDSKYFPFPWSLSQWVKASETNNYLLFMSKCLSSFCLFQVSLEDNFSHLLKIIVLPTARSSGHGLRLLSFSEDALRHMGVEKSYLEVDTSNESAKSLYLKSNYKIIHTKRKFYSNGADAHIMEKSLIS